MKNQIFYLKNTYWKSLCINENELWLSQNKVSSIEKFERAIQKTGILKSAFSFPLSSILEISFNEASESVKLKYQNEKDKKKKWNFEFGDEDLSNQFGHFLGSE